MISTIIFDMNGVITDDEELHEAATKEVFKNIGVVLSSENYREFCMGRTDVAAFKDLFEKFKIKDQTDENLIAKKSLKYQELVKGKLKVYPGVITLIKNLSEKYKLALTTSSTYEEVQAVLNQLNIRDFFEVIVTSNDVVHGKPDPEPYLLTAKKMKEPCEDCLVIEDSKNGIRSAKKAGMICVAIMNTELKGQLSLADYTIKKYEEITEELIRHF